MSRKPQKVSLDATEIARFVADGYTIITPNERLARELRNRWNEAQAAAGRQAWDTLAVSPLPGWLMARWLAAVDAGQLQPLAVLSSGRCRELWRRIIAEDPATGGQLALLRPEATIELAAQARDALLRWRIDPREPAVRQRFRIEDDCAAFLAWLERFEACLAELGATTPLDCIGALQPLADADARVVLVEPGEIAPLLWECLHSQCTRVETWSGAGPAADVSLSRYDNRRAELAGVARWVCELQRDAPAATIGVVLRDMAADRYSLEYLLRREFGCPGGSFDSLPVNFSTGITLDQAPLARDALGVLQLASSGLPLAELVDLLQSRFLHLPDTTSPGMIAFIEAVTLNTRGSTLSLQTLAALARRCGDAATGEMLDRRFATLVRGLPRGQRLPPSRWADRFGELLNSWGWPGTGMDSLEFQQLVAWEGVLDEFAACDEISGRLDLGKAVALLRRCLRNQVSQPESAGSRIQVLGPLEAAGLDFDYLWVVGLQADEWPAPARPNPFIPLGLQREQDMPHASPQREWIYAEGLLAQYQRHARVLRASFSAHTDGQPARPSALVKSWPRVDPVPAREINPGWQAARDEVSLQTVEDHLAPAVTPADDPPVTGGSGLLRDQSQCPFRAFALHRLRAETPATPGDVPGAAERGSLLHRALHHLYADLGNSDALQSASDPALEKHVATAVDRALAEGQRTPAPPVSGAWQALERDRLRRLLGDWLLLERQRPAFAIAGLEEARTLTLAGLTLQLRVDRIDVLPDGSTVIIDYKSGNCSPRDWLAERIADPQLPLYALTADDTPAALAFARVRSDGSGYAGLGSVAAAEGIETRIEKALPREAEVRNWTDLNRRWSAQLSGLAAEFTSGLASVQPQRGACKWCPLKPLCRIHSAEGGPQ